MGISKYFGLDEMGVFDYVLDDAIPDQAKMEQEQHSLMLTGDFFKKIIITKDVPAPYYNGDEVLVMSVYDFLLNEGSLDN